MKGTKNSERRKVLLTPVAIEDDQGHFVCIVIRDPATEGIVDTAVTSHVLARKAGIPLAAARRIFQAARGTAERRL